VFQHADKIEAYNTITDFTQNIVLSSFSTYKQ